jgi:hypothetical protein
MFDQIRSILGKPCWNVKRGHGSFLTLEFGQPHLVVWEPLRVPSGHWLSMRSDGQYSYVAGNRRGGCEQWRRMAEVRLEVE